MEIIAHTSDTTFNSLLFNIPEDTSSIKAAFAYNSSLELLNIASKKKIHLDYWVLFDAQNSTTAEFLNTSIESDYTQIYAVRMKASKFHPKLFYAKGYGLYIGSANMTESAISRNIEAGIFLTQKDLDSNHNVLDQIKDFFSYLENNSTKLFEDDIEKYARFCRKFAQPSQENEKDKEKNDFFKEAFSNIIPIEGVFFSPSSINKKAISAINKKQDFIREWRDTLGILLSIMKKYYSNKSYYPQWLHEQDREYSPCIMCDRFLHFYYCEIAKRNVKVVKMLHKKNKTNPNKALEEAIKIFKKTAKPYEKNALLFMNEWANTNKCLLQEKKIKHLTPKELGTLYSQKSLMVQD